MVVRLRHDTWTYDYDANTWSNVSPAAPPPARWGTRMAYDVHADRTILYGGWGGTYDNDTWSYDFNVNTWTNLNPPGTPDRLEGPTLAFAPCSNRVVLFGGYRGPSAPVILSNETWSYTYAAVAPTLQRQPASIDFGTVVQGWSGTSIAQIRNGGSGTLCYSAAASAPWLTVAPSRGTSVWEWDALTVSVDTAGLAQGPHSANIAVSSNAGSASVSVALIVNRDPVLAATGEANYVSDGFDPEVGNLPTTFSYRVSYGDADKNPPAAGNPKVDIRKGGVPISGSPFSMTEVDTADVNFIDGKGSRLDTVLPARGTDYEYQFQAADAFGNPAGDWPAASTSAPDVLNRGPFLSWVGVTPYASDGLDVEAADLSGTFVFRVTYTDPDNDQPQPGVSLTLLKGVIPVAGSPFLMAAEDPSDVTYSEGKVYTLALALRVRGNDYVYSFRASDGMDAAAGGPTVFTDAPDVENRLPRLTFLGGDFSNGVQPDTGPRGSAFTFEIVYHDDDNDGPAVVELLVEKAGTPYGLPLEMNGGNWIGSSGDFVAGRVYSIVVALLDEGSDYTFRFRASDAYEPSRTVDTLPLNGPDVGPGAGTIVVTVIADAGPLGGAQVGLFVVGQAVGPPTRTDATGEGTFAGLAPGEDTVRAAGEGARRA